MGLDMYLRANKYVSGYSFREEEEQGFYRRLVEELGAGEFVDPETPSGSVSLTVAYWRKANAIHRWFVEHVQRGVDDCGDYYVSREQLEELRDLCRLVVDTAELDLGRVRNGYTIKPGPGGTLLREDIVQDGSTITNPEQVEALLPTASGFFFGSTDYDEMYFEDVKDTIAQLDRALGLDESWDFEYHSSW